MSFLVISLFAFPFVHIGETFAPFTSAKPTDKGKSFWANKLFGKKSFCTWFFYINNLCKRCMVLWLKEKNHLLAMVQMYEYFTDMFVGFTLIAFLVMCIERYLGAYYPFFHRTSLTRRRLLILLAGLFLLPIIFAMISLNDLATSYAMVVGIFSSFYFLHSCSSTTNFS